MSEEKTLSSQLIYEGRAVRLRVDTVQMPGGRETTREVVEHSNCVAIVPVDGNDNVLLVNQFRTPVARELLEIPAGGIDADEDPVAAVRREMQEETGYLPQKVERLGGFYSSPGFCTEYLHLYLATDLVPSQLYAEDTESIRLVPVPIAEIPRLIASGSICDAKSIAGLLTFLEYRKTIGLDDNSTYEPQKIMEKARKLPISSIPDTKRDKYDYMRGFLSSLDKNEAVELRVPSVREADILRGRWNLLSAGRQPHAKKIKQRDGSYLLYLWLGETILTEQRVVSTY